MAARKKRRRRVGGPIARRWFAVGALLLVGLLYYRPLHDFVQARSQRAGRIAEVRLLQRKHDKLERELRRASSLAVLTREARSLGYIRPGEHMFIVKDIPQWRRGQRGSRGRSRSYAASHGHGR